ncbi:hypothetical protein B0H11DRAFT_2095927 [Mycena galericulata]|nr:hypothetical protein B0H11DRAFT_2095927 [Mycena galericulata]
MRQREGERQDRDEWAGAKLWSVYISEAEKYDKALVESWRSDMDGLLIFAGLFSASLTAFLMESYQALTPDPGDRTIAILTQISLQLSASFNGSSIELPEPAVFSPSAISLACNALWFLSLGFSLSCALLATLVEQWARNFIQATDMRPSPIIRARIFAYLYYGLRRFNMHAVVEIIPLLLHTSLILFFAGLVAFLQPVNAVMTAVAAVILLMMVAVYSYLTVLPIFYSDCPYRTPLSSLVRYTYLGFSTVRLPSPLRSQAPDPESGFPIHADADTPTLVQVMLKDATSPSSERDSRDRRALVWTMKSLTDDNELEPFVEGIPEVLGGSPGSQNSYDDRIGALVRHTHPDVRLIPRIESLLRGCDSILLPKGVKNRRQISCLKAIWAIDHMDARATGPFQLSQLEIFDWRSWDPTVHPYFLSAQVLSEARRARSELSPHGRLIQIIVRYLVEASHLQVPPYQFTPTCQAVTRDLKLISQDHIRDLRVGFGEIMDAHIDDLKSHPAVHQIDDIVRISLSLWQLPRSKRDACTDSEDFLFIRNVLKYFGSRDDDESLLVALGGCDQYRLSSSLRLFLENFASGPEDFQLVWCMCAFSARNPLYTVPSGYDEGTVISVRERAPPDIGPSVASLMKLAMLRAFPQNLLSSMGPDSPDSPFPLRFDEPEACSEIHWILLTEFMEDCVSSALPYMAVETLGYLLRPPSYQFRRPSRRVQLRFARSLLGLTHSITHSVDDIESVPRLDLLHLIFDFGLDRGGDYFDDPETKRTIFSVLKSCPGNFDITELTRIFRAAAEVD